MSGREKLKPLRIQDSDTEIEEQQDANKQVINLKEAIDRINFFLSIKFGLKFFCPYHFIWEFRYNDYRIFRPTLIRKYMFSKISASKKNIQV
ncbi:hypothetical protein BpHYR1_053217 [Brachionus plicatilis]|uniref:Uncharacterized protein n=1 Tax=Brachionus plicatilis TaxID=10195 RepID=A0A3M7SJD3_BRAPC|nr:hypothetical protein BpHYR1_053217 [Brachionus plicatilis]